MTGMNETEFVEYLTSAFPFSRGFGIGDDTSVVRLGSPAPGKESFQLITKDILIENVHFRLDDFSLGQLARKSLAVNLSDIAAMGGVPHYFYLGLGFPSTLPSSSAREFFEGLRRACDEWNVELAGGDFSSSPVMMISITLIGESSAPVYRSGAQTGDLVCITGPTGCSAAGLKLLLDGVTDSEFIDIHKNPSPELNKGPILARYANAMLDVSDGVLLDLNRILNASKKGGRIFYENVPVSPKLKQLCIDKNWNEPETVLAGGEDYVLLFTVSRENEKKLASDHPGMGYRIIGEITAAPGLEITHNGSPLNISKKGYDHFSNSN